VYFNLIDFNAEKNAEFRIYTISACHLPCRRHPQVCYRRVIGIGRWNIRVCRAIISGILQMSRTATDDTAGGRARSVDKFHGFGGTAIKRIE
jgi:hypothetical protein